MLIIGASAVSAEDSQPPSNDAVILEESSHKAEVFLPGETRVLDRYHGKHVGTYCYAEGVRILVVEVAFNVDRPLNGLVIPSIVDIRNEGEEQKFSSTVVVDLPAVYLKDDQYQDWLKMREQTTEPVPSR